MELRLLGQVEARTGCGIVPLRGAMQRALLALLLLERGAPVSRDRLVDSLWHEPPASASHALDVHVSALRKSLREHGEGDRLSTHAHGYSFRIERGELDLDRFEVLVAEARNASAEGDAERAARLLRDSLVLWQGTPLADLGDAPFVVPARRRLEEARLEALGARFDAELASGRRDGLHAELRELVEQHPDVERFVAQCMLALYRDGRQSEALELCRRHNDRLRTELGLEPGAQLRELQRAILRHDPSLEPLPRVTLLPVSPPPARGALVGREKELGRLLEALKQDERLVTLTGPGGVGKTRLAAELAAEGGAGFSIVAYADLTTVLEPELVVPTIARALGIEEHPGRPVVEEIASALGKQRTLLVLDAVEHVRACGVELARLSAQADSLTFVCTSRTRLGLAGEWELPVPPLRSSDAMALLVERARRTRRDFAVTDDNAADVARICDRVDGLPLALELAAARLGTMSPAELLGRLERPLGVLVGGPRDAPARQQTMRATIAWSVDLLDEAHRRTFDYLGVFTGGWTLAAAADVCASEHTLAESLHEQLSALADRSLIRSAGEHGGTHRFEMLDTIASLARERLLERGRDEEARRRHAEHYVLLAERAERELTGTAQAAWVDLLESELGNLRAATRWASESGDQELVLRLVGSLWHFWERRCYFREARAWLGEALSAEPLDLRVRAKALVAQAKFTGRTGDYDRTAELLDESIAIFARLGDATGESCARANLGWLLTSRGRLEEALAQCEQARSLADAARDRFATWAAVNSLAAALLALDRVDEAEPLFHECLALSREGGDEHGTVAALGNLGLVAIGRGQFRRAEEYLDESLLLARLVEDAWYVGNICVNLAYVAWHLDDLGRAEDLLREGLLEAADLGEIPLQAEALDGFAALAAVSERFDRAAVLSGAAAALREVVGARVDGLCSFRETHERLLPARMADDALRRGVARGRRLLVGRAIDFALGDERVVER